MTQMLFSCDLQHCNSTLISANTPSTIYISLCKILFCQSSCNISNIICSVDNGPVLYVFCPENKFVRNSFAFRQIVMNPEYNMYIYRVYHPKMSLYVYIFRASSAICICIYNFVHQHYTYRVHQQYLSRNSTILSKQFLFFPCSERVNDSFACTNYDHIYNMTYIYNVSMPCMYKDNVLFHIGRSLSLPNFPARNPK